MNDLNEKQTGIGPLRNDRHKTRSLFKYLNEQLTMHQGRSEVVSMRNIQDAFGIKKIFHTFHNYIGERIAAI